MQPITPKEVRNGLNNIPDEIIEIVNSLLERNLCNGKAMIQAFDVISRWLDKFPKEEFDIKWLNFEILYRSKGWKVTYDAPIYCEITQAVFYFEEKQ